MDEATIAEVVRRVLVALNHNDDTIETTLEQSIVRFNETQSRVAAESSQAFATTMAELNRSLLKKDD